MNALRLWLTAAAAPLCVSIDLRADLYLGRAPTSVCTSPQAATGAAEAAVAATPNLSCSHFLRDISPACIARGGCEAGHLAHPAGPGRTGGVRLPPRGMVRELPPLPGSATLFLSAVLSMGGWHLVRSARHFHWAALPDWYHAGGPLQIGHAPPLDLHCHALPPCCFERPCGEREPHVLVRRVPIARRPRRNSQTSPDLVGPRAPPGVW